MIKIRRFRRQAWPHLGLYPSGLSDIKEMSPEDVERLMNRAEERGWSAVGVPDWFRRGKDNIHHVMLVVFGVEERSVYRCVATAILNDRSGHSFTLDVAIGDFNGFPNITTERLVELAHLYLAGFPMLPLDPDQEEAWKRLENRQEGRRNGG